LGIIIICVYLGINNKIEISSKYNWDHDSCVNNSLEDEISDQFCFYALNLYSLQNDLN
jgi:hypothetical protein